VNTESRYHTCYQCAIIIIHTVVEAKALYSVNLLSRQPSYQIKFITVVYTKLDLVLELVFYLNE
jgi:hypothetical protein